jgi:hypothetical protein
MLDGFFRLGESRITTRKGHEPVTVLIDGAGATEERQLSNEVVRQWWSEAGVDELGEAIPRRLSPVQLQTLEP